MTQPSTDTPRKKTGGRQRGTPNRVTRDFRETVALVLEENRENLSLWLDQVANGTLRVVDGQVVGEPPNPAKALDLIVKLAEYAVPKMTRVDLEGNSTKSAGVTNIQIEFVDAAARTALPTTMARLPEPSPRH
ncbi:hypothetical protein ACIPRI_12500 [Variovorax sp. LARHSF232]